MGGGASSATKQQQQLTLEETQQQMGFQQQLMSLFQQQFANQKAQLDFLKGVMQPVITQAQGGHGFSDSALAAMRTGATDQLSGQFQNAQAALNQTLKTSGDANVPSGVTAGADMALVNSEAQAKAGAQNQITLADQQQAQSNLFNAANVLNGVAAESSPNALESGALQGGSEVAGLGGAQSGLQNAITQANSDSFFGRLSGSLASSLGQGFGTLLSGGSNAFGSGYFCHIAASFWGWGSAKTDTIRMWMLLDAPSWLRKFYAKNSRWMAKTPLRWAFFPLFRRVLARSLNG